MAADPLSATLSALADPTRRGILARLALGDATVNELAAWLESYRQFWDRSLDSLAEYLKEMPPAPDGRRRPRSTKPKK
jgi:DNA-binding transcriptional ArsR family regulator